MAEPLTAEDNVALSALIDDILANSDLNTISAKRIRKELQGKLDYDITAQKKPITDLIMQRFDNFEPPSKTTPPPTTNGASHSKSPEPSPSATSPSAPTSPTKRKAEDDSDDLSDVAGSPPPKRAKKIKQTKAEDDAAYARRLQAELDAVNARSTRGGGAGRRKAAAATTKKATKTKKKSKAKVGSDDDSEVEGGVDKPEKEKKGGFHKPMLLSEPLAALLDTPSLSRPQTVKQIWVYVKARELQDPSDKRQIRCDDKLRAVFKQDRVHMFTMNKLLAQHLFPADAVVEE